MGTEPFLPEESLRLAKKALREQVIARRDAVDSALRLRYSQLVTDRLLALPAYLCATAVAAYASFGSEFDTRAFLAGVIGAGKRLLLPRINRAARALELREVEDLDADLVAGVWGIREPSGRCPIRQSSAVEFMLVPGVAFTRKGERLGYGGGFYDRLLAGLSPDVERVVAALSVQMVDELPTGARDQRVHRIITEKDEYVANREPERSPKL